MVFLFFFSFLTKKHVDHEHQCHPFSPLSLSITQHYTVYVTYIINLQYVVVDVCRLLVHTIYWSVCCSKVPLALTYDARHKVTCMDIDEQKKKLLTVGSDKIIKVSYIVDGLHK